MGRLRAGSVIGAASALVLCASAPLAQGADMLGGAETAKGVYESPHQYFVGLSARGLYGHMEREGSDFFRKLKIDGDVEVVDPDFVGFDNDEEFSGFEGEALIGKRFGDYAIAFFVGGSVISSDVSDSGSIKAGGDDDKDFHLMLPAPELDKSRTFQWVNTNQFDINDYDYDNGYDRREIAVGFRPTFYYGGDPAPSMKDVSLKDGLMPAENSAQHMLQPMVFATLGTVEVNEDFSGFTDNDPKDEGEDSPFAGEPGNIQFAYDNDIESDFTGIGFGLSVRGPLHNGGLKVGYFATAKATAEFHDASATASSFYDQVWDDPGNFGIRGCTGVPAPPCDDFIRNSEDAVTSSKNMSEEKTVWTLHLEGGLTFGLTEGVNLEVGGRYRRTEAPQVIIDGTQDAYIAFEEAEEMGGFVGLTAQF